MRDVLLPDVADAPLAWLAGECCSQDQLACAAAVELGSCGGA
jgi:hypothetical protein